MSMPDQNKKEKGQVKGFWGRNLLGLLSKCNPKGNQPWIFIGRTEAEALILLPPDEKSWLAQKDPDAGKDWGQEEKRMRWHHWLNGLEFEQTQGDSTACYSSWGRRVRCHLVTEQQKQVQRECAADEKWTKDKSKGWSQEVISGTRSSGTGEPLPRLHLLLWDGDYSQALRKGLKWDDTELLWYSYWLHWNGQKKGDNNQDGWWQWL